MSKKTIAFVLAVMAYFISIMNHKILAQQSSYVLPPNYQIVCICTNCDEGNPSMPICFPGSGFSVATCEDVVNVCSSCGNQSCDSSSNVIYSDPTTASSLYCGSYGFINSTELFSNCGFSTSLKPPLKSKARKATTLSTPKESEKTSIGIKEETLPRKKP
jgi:hypothetical protein